MKKCLSTLVLLMIAGFIYAQTTYYWVGGTGPVSFTTNSNWNTALNGTGTSRSAEAATDILVFDGTNVGGSTAATGAVTATLSSTSFAQLILQNNAIVTLQRTTVGGTGTITINGDGTGIDDLLIGAGCSLTTTVSEPTASENIAMAATATGTINGTLNITGGGCRISVTNTTAGGALFFDNGALCNVNTVSSYPFGTNTGVPNAIVFKSGSTLVYKGGNSIFTNTATYSPIVFQSGSTCNIAASIPSAFVSSSQFFAGRRFSNVMVSANQTVTADLFYNIDKLAIELGSAFYLKTSGASSVSGDIINNGTFGAATGVTSSNLILKGIVPQTIGGTGTFAPLGAVSVATDADVTINKNLVVNGSGTSLVTGKINFSGNTLSGSGSFQTRLATINTTAVTTGPAASNTLVLDATAYASGINTAGVYTGLLVSGTGIAPNTYIIGTSSSTSTITLSNPTTDVVSSITVSGNIPVFRTSSSNGINGSVTVSGTISLASGTNYVFDGPTLNPFSITSTNTPGDITFNAAATTNKSQALNGVLTVNAGKLTIRPTDTLRIRNGTDIGGAPFNSSKYIVTAISGSNIGVLRMDAVTTSKLLPIGSATHYLPFTVSPFISSGFAASVFEGITNDGIATGTPLTAIQKQVVVDAVWNINRINGSGNAGIQIGWDEALEGATFTTLANSQIGILQNNGIAWNGPVGTGNNTANTASVTVTGFTPFSIGSIAQVNPLVFNAIPSKTYGDADFSAGVSSLNTAQPLIYTSSNNAVATVSAAGIIHITGAGTADITVTQASDGTYPATNITRTLTVNKAALTIKADNLSKIQDQANPALTATYTGFVPGESQTVLLTPAILTTSADINSLPGSYPITVSGATAANYNITFVAAVLTVFVRLNQTISFNALPAKTYGNADFAAGATSTNNTIPLNYTSSDMAVATVSGNIIHITGAGNTTITASQAGNAGYFPATDVAVILTVNKAALTIKVLDTVKVQGQANPVFTIIYAGFVLGDTASNLSTLPTVSTTATASSIPGNYVLTAAGAGSSNYSFTYIPGQLKINPANANEQSFTAYFNTNGNIAVNIFSPEADLGDVIVYDITGKFMTRKNIYMPAGIFNTELSLYPAQAGLYVIALKGKKKTIAKIIRIIK